MQLNDEMLSEGEYSKIVELAKNSSSIKASDTCTYRLIHHEEVNNLLGVLKTLADSLGLEEKRLEAIKGMLTRSLWDWYLMRPAHGLDKANWILARADDIKAVLEEYENLLVGKIKKSKTK